MDYDDLRERAERSTGAEREAWERALRQLREADAVRAESAKLLMVGDMMRACLEELVNAGERAQRVITALKEDLDG